MKIKYLLQKYHIFTEKGISPLSSTNTYVNENTNIIILHNAGSDGNMFFNEIIEAG